MTDGLPGTSRRAADLRWMRASTTVTLWVLVVTAAFLQLVLGPGGGADGLRQVLLVVLTVVSVVLALAAVPSLLRTTGGVSERNMWVVLLLVVATATWVVALLPPFGGWGWGFLLVTAGGMLSCVVPRWWSLAAILGTLAVLTVGGALASQADQTPVVSTPVDDGTTLVVVSTLVVITTMPLSAVWVLRVVLRLDEARRTASDLAVATERLRFATDLHDIQGHHLQVIALKGELAERRLLADQADLAAAELADIRAIAQAALDDTRAVVNDYRTVTVAVEARNAAAVLRSADIRCEAQIDVPDLPALAGAVFAVAIREAATNILRHSRATEASLELVLTPEQDYRLTVTNDGSGPVRTGGTGLSGLTERVASWDGTVSTSRRGDTFTLVVRIPARTAALQSEVAR